MAIMGRHSRALLTLGVDRLGLNWFSVFVVYKRLDWAACEVPSILNLYVDKNQQTTKSLSSSCVGLRRSRGGKDKEKNVVLVSNCLSESTDLFLS